MRLWKRALRHTFVSLLTAILVHAYIDTLYREPWHIFSRIWWTRTAIWAVSIMGLLTVLHLWDGAPSGSTNEHH